MPPLSSVGEVPAYEANFFFVSMVFVKDDTFKHAILREMACTGGSVGQFKNE